MEKTSNLFSINLRQISKKKFNTFEQAAAKIGISLSFLNDLMSGKKSPSLEMIYQISEKLEVQASDLFFDEGHARAEATKSELIIDIIKLLPSLDEYELRSTLRTVADGLTDSASTVTASKRSKQS